MIPISVFVVTLNEGRNIERMLKSVAGCAEVIVMDSGSTDDSVCNAFYAFIKEAKLFEITRDRHDG